MRSVVSPFAVASGLTIACGLTVGAPAGPAATTALCLALLAAGLPHGSFDIALLRGGGTSRPEIAGILAVYLGLAALALAVWSAAPPVALGLFLAVSIVHFAEDWHDTGVPLLAGGISLMLFTAPVLFHRDETARLFQMLAGAGGGADVADLLILLAIPAVGLGLAGIGALWAGGHRRRAVDAACAVAAMTVLPPLVGFALFFCLFHSPMHFREALGRLSWTQARRWLPVAAPVTLAALGGAAVLYAAAPPLAMSSRMVAATFVTLAVLTIPHMGAPIVVAALRRRGLLHAPELPSAGVAANAATPAL